MKTCERCKALETEIELAKLGAEFVVGCHKDRIRKLEAENAELREQIRDKDCEIELRALYQRVRSPQ